MFNNTKILSGKGDPRANDVMIIIKNIQMYDAEAYELHPASMKYENVKRQRTRWFVVVRLDHSAKPVVSSCRRSSC